MTAEELTAIVGENAAFTFICRLGGDRYYVPKNPTPQLVERLGGDAKAAERLGREMGGTFVAVPVAKRWRILKLHRDGMSEKQIALALSVTWMTVRNALKSTNALGHEQRTRDAA